MNELLRVEDAGVSLFRSATAGGAISVLHHVNLAVGQGESVGLLGPNGSGKSTLARMILDLLPPGFTGASGRLFWKNRLVKPGRWKDLRGKRVFYSPQNARSSLNPGLSIKKQFADIPGLRPGELSALLFDLGIDHPEQFLKSYPVRISEGESQRCLAAMAMLSPARLLILDEPTTGLDGEALDKLRLCLKRQVTENHRSLLLISHDAQWIKSVAGRFYFCQAGEICPLTDTDMGITFFVNTD